MSRVASNKSKITAAIPAACADERAAVEFMELQRWGDDPHCPRCESPDVYIMKDRKTGERQSDWRWRCRECGRQYTVRIGTVFEDSRIPLRHWCYAFWRACTSKKGVSAKEIERQTGLSYKSALFMMNRIWYAMAPDDDGTRFSGDVEVDESYFGGKPRNRDPKNRTRAGRSVERKAAVFGMVERNGRVRAQPVTSVSGSNLKPIIRRNVDIRTRIISDEWSGYKGLGIGPRRHETVNHSKREWARGDVHTNTIESFWALCKRSVHGIHHSLSKEHLHRYVGEWCWRYNHRKMDDGERTVAAIKAAEGKRLMYRQPSVSGKGGLVLRQLLCYHAILLVPAAGVAPASP